MNEVLLYTLSTKLTKALTTNSSADQYTLGQTDVTPLTASVPADSFTMGSGGIFAANRILFMPYGDGAPGATFSMRLYYWNHVGEAQGNWCWIPGLLIEFVCTIGDLQGPVDPASTQIQPSERFCSGMTATAGSYGKDGDLITGTGLPSLAVVDIKGARRISFDFQRIDANVSMNCLWARA